MNRNGDEQARLTNNPSEDRSPVWTPDGNKIAFQSNRNGYWVEYVMTADGRVELPTDVDKSLRAYICPR